MSDIKDLMKEKIKILDEAARAYYAEGREIMSNLEYDRLYDELAKLEEQSGIVLAGSPTQKVGYEVMSELPKEEHPSPMLSLDKTKDRAELAAWLGAHKGLLSWKLDGLTIVLTYNGGELTKAVTRGNGRVGEVITPNARTFVNLPLTIPFKGEVIIRGEAVITYKDFEEINRQIPDADAKYKNPRNLCSGSVRQLSSKITAERRVHLYAFSLVSAQAEGGMAQAGNGTVQGEGGTAQAGNGTAPDFGGSREKQMEWLRGQGFDVVAYRAVTGETVEKAVAEFEREIAGNPLPSDGLVLLLDDIEYGASLGSTAKFPRDAIAFKWRDQEADTVLREIEWSASRTGLINPVAIFDPVELEGTTVTRASLHNVSIMEELALGIGDTIRVYKANMIIPQVSENMTRSGAAKPPAFCPVCGEPTKINDESGVKTLVCINPDCLAKQLKSFALFVSREAMNIDGLSEMTIEKLIAKGIIKELADIFRLSDFEAEITAMEGFGKKSFDNLCAAADAARRTTPARLLYALGVPGIGVANARAIAAACRNDWDKIRHLTKEELTAMDGIGDIMADGFTAFFADEKNAKIVDELAGVIDLDQSFEAGETFLQGLTFVITGSLNGYENRDELKELIEAAGGKVAGSVSAKTSYLINNDVTSSSGKNKKAKELGIPIISEEEISAWLRDKAPIAAR